MRLPPAGFSAAAPDVEATDPELSPAPLLGAWSATRWQYTSRLPPERVVDLICDQDGSFMLSLSLGCFILVWEVGGGARSTLAGSVRVDGDVLEFRPVPDRPGEAVHFRVGPSELALSSEESAWHFGEDREDPAAWVAVFVRV